MRNLAGGGGLQRASTDASGAQANGSSGNASLSADGRYVSFESSASNLVAGDANGNTDVFVKDLDQRRRDVGFAGVPTAHKGTTTRPTRR